MSKPFDKSTPVARRTRSGQVDKDNIHGGHTPNISNRCGVTSIKSGVLRVFNNKGTLTKFHEKYLGTDDGISPSGVKFGEVKNVPGCTGDDYWISKELFENTSMFIDNFWKNTFKRCLRKGGERGFDVRAECVLNLNKEWFHVIHLTETKGKQLFSSVAPSKKVYYLSLVKKNGIAPKVRMTHALQRWILIQASYHGLEFPDRKNKDGSLVVPKHRMPHHHLEMFFNGTIEDREWEIVSGEQGDDWDKAKVTWRLIWDGGADENTFFAVQCGRWIVKFEKKAWSVRLFDEVIGMWVNSISVSIQKLGLIKVYEVFFFSFLHVFVYDNYSCITEPAESVSSTRLFGKKKRNAESVSSSVSGGSKRRAVGDDSVVLRKAEVEKIIEEIGSGHSVSKMLFKLLGPDATPIPQVALLRNDDHSVASSLDSVASSISSSKSIEVNNRPIFPFIFINAKGDSVEVNPNVRNDKKFEGLTLMKGFENEGLDNKSIFLWCRQYRSLLCFASGIVNKNFLTDEDREILRLSYKNVETRDWKSGENFEDVRVLVHSAKISLAIATSRNMPVPISEEKKKKSAETKNKSTHRYKKNPDTLLMMFRGTPVSSIYANLESLAFVSLILSGEDVMNSSNRVSDNALLKYHVYCDLFEKYFENNPENLFDKAEFRFLKKKGELKIQLKVEKLEKEVQVDEIGGKSVDDDYEFEM